MHINTWTNQRLKTSQWIVRNYQGDNSFYNNHYRPQEESYWFSLLPYLDAFAKKLKKGAVLDIGCAYGTLLIYCRAFGLDCYGIDILTNYLKPAMAEKYKINFSCCNIEVNPIPWERKFDIIIFTEVLEHLNYNPVGVIGKIYSALESNGLLLVSTPNKLYWGECHYTCPFEVIPYYQDKATFLDKHFKHYDSEELKRLMSLFGFSSLKIWEHKKSLQCIAYK